jgi:8-oxo-dGTP pyrophosphatase MutT (NUDIX family)
VTADIARIAARVLLVDAVGRVLLFRGFDPHNPEIRYWITAGGGVEPGESPAEAASRELFEETGLRLGPDEFAGPVHRDVTRFPFAGDWYRQEQDFFVARIDSWEVSTAGFNALEHSSVDAHRWWSVAELEATGETVYPTDLAQIVRAVLEG